MVNRFETGFTNPVTGCTENPVLTALVVTTDSLNGDDGDHCWRWVGCTFHMYFLCVCTCILAYVLLVYARHCTSSCWESFWSLKCYTYIMIICNTYRASLVCENIIGFSWDFCKTILVGKFPSREIGEKCASRSSQIITQLYPINLNFTGSRCNAK